MWSPAESEALKKDMNIRFTMKGNEKEREREVPHTFFLFPGEKKAFFQRMKYALLVAAN